MTQRNEADQVPTTDMQTSELEPLRPRDGDMVAVSIYANGRDVVGTTVFVDRPRWAQVWTLDCDERLLLLGQGRRLLHWEPSLESQTSAEARLLDWLTEPIVA